MVVFKIFGIPFQYRFTKQEELYHLLIGIVDLLAEMTDFPVLVFQRLQSPPFVETGVRDAADKDGDKQVAKGYCLAK